MCNVWKIDDNMQLIYCIQISTQKNSFYNIINVWKRREESTLRKNFDESVRNGKKQYITDVLW